MNQRLVDLERDPDSSELINEIFRAAHTLKGNARLLNLREVSNVAHEMETIFGEIRSGTLRLESNMTDLLFEALDVLQGCVDRAARQENSSVDTSNIINRLKAVWQPPEEAAPVVVSAPVEIAPPPVTIPQSGGDPAANPAMLSRFRDEANAQLLRISQRLIDLERSADQKEHIRDTLRDAHTLKGNASLLGFVSVKNVAHELEEIFTAVRDKGFVLKAEMLDVLFEALEYLQNAIAQPPSRENTAALQAQLHALIAPTETAITTVAPTPVSQPTPPSSSSPSRVQGTTLQVDVSKLDDLMNITGELVLTKMEADSTLNNLRAVLELLRTRQRVSNPIRTLLATTDRDPSEITTLYETRDTLLAVNQIDQRIEALLRGTFKEFEEHTNHLQNTVDELESNVLSIRMLPIGTLFDEFRPLVRNLSRELERKNPDLVLTGNEIELDKKVLEGIRDPLVHLVRNGLDHGIELPDVRVASGKSEEGRLVMAASQEGGYVYIRISDDGAGINPERLRLKAVEKGFMTEAKARNASENEILNLIYEPGFSTTPIITYNSGRGVGMDVVKKNIERLGGQVSVSSQLGKGTTFTLKVPLTIATSRALLVKVDNQIYAIPAPNIEAMLYLTPKEIGVLAGRDVVLHRGNLVPLVKLADLLGKNKNLDHPIFRWQALNSERNGLALASMGLAVKISTNGVSTNGNGNGNHADGPANLDMYPGLTLADPAAQARIQQMQAGDRNRNVTRFVFERMPGVIVGSGDRRFCLLVDSLEDEIEVVVKSLSRILKVHNVSSATILGDGRVVMILDVPNLVSAAREILGRTGIRRKLSDKPVKKRILVVDDSITTRELEKSILEASGYHVDTADDGTLALDVLNRDNSYDLVISDIEMPFMNGFELTSRIKSSAALKHLPVIIVSSLNSEENKRKGIDAGAQAYITKGDFNQNNLLDTIEYLTS